MIFIILAGNWCSSYAFARPHLFLIIVALPLSYAHKQVSLLSFCSFLVDRIVYQHVFYCIVWSRCIFAHHFLSFPLSRCVELRLPFLPSFCLCLSLYLSPTLIVTHHKHVGLVLLHICTTKSIIVYIMFRFAFFSSFGVVRLFVVGQ